MVKILSFCFENTYRSECVERRNGSDDYVMEFMKT